MHDAVEQSLLKEVATLRDAQERFKMMLEKVVRNRNNAGSEQFPCVILVCSSVHFETVRQRRL